MGRGLFFVLGVLVGGVAVFLYVTINHNVRIVPVAQMSAPPAQAPQAVPPQIVAQAPKIAPPIAPQAPVPAPTSMPSQSAAITPNAEPALVNTNLLLPVQGIKPSELIDTFNQTRGGTRIHEALDIMASVAANAPSLTPITNVPTPSPLAGALIAPTAKHHAAITDAVAFGALLRSIDVYTGQPVTKLALRFTALVFQRPGEIRQAEWSEIDFDGAVWTIPAERMKQR